MQQAKASVGGLKKCHGQLVSKPRWLGLKKIDMIRGCGRAERVQGYVKRFKWKGPVFEISALAREGTDLLAKNIYQHVRKEQQIENPDPANIDPRFVPDESDPRFASGA